jgi:hypothetical protein
VKQLLDVLLQRGGGDAAVAADLDGAKFSARYEAVDVGAADIELGGGMFWRVEQSAVGVQFGLLWERDKLHTH